MKKNYDHTLKKITSIRKNTKNKRVYTDYKKFVLYQVF